MAATPYDFSTTQTQKRRFRLPKLGAAGLGGGLGLFIVALGLLAIGLGWNGMAGGGGEVNGVPNLNAQLPWLLSGGILDMIGARHTPVRAVPPDQLRPEALAGASMAVDVDAASLTPQQREVLKAFTRSGGTLLTGPADWKESAVPDKDKITLDDGLSDSGPRMRCQENAEQDAF